MCGRFTLALPPEVLARLFVLDALPELLPRYNIAPTQPIALVRQAGRSTGHPRRVLEIGRWGLVPRGSADLKVGAKLINARQETLFDKPVFRSAARWRRCLVPADGFFEWKAEGKKKRPIRITLTGQRPFAMAGVYERFEPPGAPPVETVSIVTTGANALIAPIHDRMPVILREEDFALWLDPGIEAREPLEPLLLPLPADHLELHPASTRLNDVNNDDAACLVPEGEPEPRRADASPRGAQLGFGFTEAVDRRPSTADSSGSLDFRRTGE